MYLSHNFRLFKIIITGCIKSHAFPYCKKCFYASGERLLLLILTTPVSLVNYQGKRVKVHRVCCSLYACTRPMNEKCESIINMFLLLNKCTTSLLAYTIFKLTRLLISGMDPLRELPFKYLRDFKFN